MNREADVRASARALVELLEQARPIPLTHLVRFDKQDSDELVEAIRTAAGSTPDVQPIVEAATAVAKAARNAKPVPLTYQVRLPRERLDEMVRALRTAGA
jgi:hypothetical protein